MVTVLMFPHGGNRNRGCEAIVRTTCDLLGHAFVNPKSTVISFDHKHDSYTHIPGVKEYIPPVGYHTWTPAWFILGVVGRLGIDRYITIPNYLEKLIKRYDLCMSIGGDNYCYKEFYPSYMIAVDKIVKENGKPLVLWGASIEQSLIVDETRKDLESFDLITVRESISYEALEGLGINNNLWLYPDPAFTLKKEDVILPQNWIVGNTIGINISPVVMRYENNPGILLKSLVSLIKFLIEKFDCAIALIPHVFLTNRSDLVPLREIFQQFSDTGRVILIGENHTAPELKGFISKCRLFIGARTHATIAAYSSFVPTLALGYSVKARGIARDIFKDEKGLVLPIQSLSSEKALFDSFNELLEREVDLRLRLTEIMPDYINQAHLAIEPVSSLF